MTTSVLIKEDRLSKLRGQVTTVDEKLAKLQQRAFQLRGDIDSVTEKEQRAFRLFAQADTEEKRKLEAQLETLTQSRIAVERELRALTLAIAEEQDVRERLWRELGPLEESERARERREQIERLRRTHEQAQADERRWEQALAEARDATNRAFFNWRAAVDQLAVDEQLAAQEQIKAAEAQRRKANGTLG